MSGPACLWCGAPSTALCDFSLGFIPNARGLVTLGGDGAPPSEHFTCDAPICGEHRRQIGHICGPRPADYDSIDHCPVHADAPQSKEHRLFGDAQSTVTAARRAVRVAAARSRVRQAPGDGRVETVIAETVASLLEDPSRANAERALREAIERLTGSPFSTYGVGAKK